jgi:hypothetical protein
MLPGWNLATKTHIACDVGVRKALHLDFETCKMYIYYGVYNHPIGNCLRVYVVMRTLYMISGTTQWGLYLGKCLTFLMDIISRGSHKWPTLKLSACFDLFSSSLPIHNANKILCKRNFHRIIL